MTNPKISIIIPVYNVEPYLRRCLNSIIGQTYKNLEIILVDDGSTDGSGVICDEYRKKDPRFIVIHQENGGVSSARNAGLNAATGEWIGFVDGDDWVEPDMYAYLLELVERNGADVAQCGLFFDEGAVSIEMFCAETECILSSDAEQLNLRDLEKLGNSTCNKLYRKDVLRDLVYDLACPMGEDLLFNLQMIQRSASIVLGAEAKYHYIQHSASACHKPPNYEFIHSHRNVLKQAATLFDKGTAIYTYFVAERLRMDMHNCSRIVQFPELDLGVLKAEIQADLRAETFQFLGMGGITIKDKLKLLLIAWAWGVYRVLVIESKKIKHS